jgi:zinc transporter ZupT
MGDETIAWPQSGAATSVWIIAWLATWFALVISALAILFAFTVTGGALILVGFLMFAPVLLLAGFIIWLLRRANRSDKGKDADPHSAITTPSPSVGSA